jgi:hypothetical protein
MPSAVVHLSSSVRILTLPSRLKDLQLWDVLDALLRPRRSDFAGGLEEIHVQADEDGSFLWTDGDKSLEHAQFIGRLLSYAPKLRARGIRVVDDMGRSPDLVW